MRRQIVAVCGMLLLASTLSVPAFSKGDAETAKIETILRDIFRRADVEKILPTIDKDAKVYGWVGGLWQDLQTIIRTRDRERALGSGSVEDVIGRITVNYDGSLAVAIVATHFVTKDGKDNHYRANTIMLRKKGNGWIILSWHCSKTGTDAPFPTPEWG